MFGERFGTSTPTACLPGIGARMRSSVRRQRVREIVAQAGDAGDLRARGQLQLVARDARTRDGADEAGLDAVLGERAEQRARDALGVRIAADRGRALAQHARVGQMVRRLVAGLAVDDDLRQLERVGRLGLRHRIGIERRRHGRRAARRPRRGRGRSVSARRLPGPNTSGKRASPSSSRAATGRAGPDARGRGAGIDSTVARTTIPAERAPRRAACALPESSAATEAPLRSRTPPAIEHDREQGRTDLARDRRARVVQRVTDESTLGLRIRAIERRAAEGDQQAEAHEHPTDPERAEAAGLDPGEQRGRAGHEHDRGEPRRTPNEQHEPVVQAGSGKRSVVAAPLRPAPRTARARAARAPRGRAPCPGASRGSRTGFFARRAAGLRAGLRAGFRPALVGRRVAAIRAGFAASSRSPTRL